jgi:hypothetical protein
MRIITTINRRHRASAAVVSLIVMTGLAATAVADMRWVDDAATGKTTLMDVDRPVLTYNFQNVPVPPGVTGRYAVARSDYIHPLYGLDGEVLTKDYSPDHPHHRGLYWAWPEVTWKGEMRDLHALQGVFARPVRILRAEATKGCAVLEAVNVWDWAGAGPIVREETTISVSSVTDRMRIIDFEFRFHALVDEVTLARR